MQNYEKQIENLILKKGLSETQRAILRKWSKRKTRSGRIPQPRTILSSLFHLVDLGIYLQKDYEDMMVEDIWSFLDHLKEKGLKESTIALSTEWINALMRWLGKENCVIRIAPPDPRNMAIGDPNKQVTQEDLLKLIEACRGKTKKRNMAIISLLFDSGMRARELEALNVGSVDLNNERPRVWVNGKTGRRQIPLNYSIPYLLDYMKNKYPDDLEAPLFVNERRGTRLTYSGIYKLVKRTANRAGIDNVHPHLFRHGRARDLIRKGLNPRLLMSWGGWSNLRTPLIYSEIDGDELHDAVGEVDGVLSKKKTKKSFILDHKKCPCCDEDLTPNAKQCTRCNMILDPEKRKKQEDRTETLERMFQMLSEIYQEISESGKTREGGFSN